MNNGNWICKYSDSCNSQRKPRNNYHPHPKNGKGNVFSLFVSPHPGGGTPSWKGEGVPISAREVPHPGRRGVPTSTSLGGTPSLPGWSTPPQDGVLPARMGYPPPGDCTVSTCYVAGGTPLVVSCRRTFLFQLIISKLLNTCKFYLSLKCYFVH